MGGSLGAWPNLETPRMHPACRELVLNRLLLNFPQIHAAKAPGNNKVWEPGNGAMPQFQPQVDQVSRCAGSPFTSAGHQLPLPWPPQQAVSRWPGLQWDESFIKHLLYAGRHAGYFTDVTAFFSPTCPLRLSFSSRFSSRRGCIIGPKHPARRRNPFPLGHKNPSFPVPTVHFLGDKQGLKSEAVSPS